MVRKLSLFAVVIVLALGIHGVGAQDNSQARLRLAHLVIDVDNVDLYMDNNLTLQNVPFFDISDGVNVPAGPHTFTVTPNDRKIDRALVPPVNVNVVNGDSYIIAFIGQQADSSFTLLPIDETAAFRSAALDTSGEQDIILNGLSNGPAVDVYFGDTAAITNLKFGDFKAVNFPQHTTPFQFVQAGDRQHTVVYDAGDSYGLPNNTSFIALAGNYSAGGQGRFSAFVSNYSPLKIPDYLDGWSTHPQMQFNTFMKLLRTTKQDNTLNGVGPFTVFVPSDEVFSQLPPGTVDKLVANPKALSRILSYHIVPQRLTINDLRNLADSNGDVTLKTLLGTTMTISMNDFSINKAVNITSVDFETANGVIQLIDGVLQLTGGPTGNSAFLPGLPAQLDF